MVVFIVCIEDIETMFSDVVELGYTSRNAAETFIRMNAALGKETLIPLNQMCFESEKHIFTIKEITVEETDFGIFRR